MRISSDNLRKLGWISRAIRPHEQGWSAISDIAVALESDAKVRSRAAAEPRLSRLIELLYRRTERESAPALPQTSEFFRLSLEGRLVLCALRARALGYEELGGLLGMSAHQVQSLAWKCRLLLGGGEFPSAPLRARATCPEYDSSAPWTQAYLDRSRSGSGSEKFFLETHLRECAPCRATLSQARALIARADEIVDQAAPDPGMDAKELQEVLALLERIDSKPQSWLRTDDGYRAMVIALGIIVAAFLLQGWLS